MTVRSSEVLSGTPVKKDRWPSRRLEQLDRQLVDDLTADHPQSVRHQFYRQTNVRLPVWVPKDDSGYDRVQRRLVLLRERGIIPYGWITDHTRRGYFTRTFASPAEAVEQIAGLYRRSYWPTAPCYVEVWVESRSIAGVVHADCERYAVPLYPAGGFTSHTLVWQATQHIGQLACQKPVHVLYIGDFDGSGTLIDQAIEKRFRRHLPGADITFHRVAVTAEQVGSLDLPTKPGKPHDLARGFTGTVEAEAMPAGLLRRLLREAIEAFIDPRAFKVMQVNEESERQMLRLFGHELREAFGAQP